MATFISLLMSQYLLRVPLNRQLLISWSSRVGDAEDSHPEEEEDTVEAALATEEEAEAEASLHIDTFHGP